MKAKIEEIANQDGRYHPRSVRFVYEGLIEAAKHIPDDPPHVTGEALCWTLKKMAVEKWGRMAALVLRSWGVKTTRDFGEIMYMMVNQEWISAQPSDSIDDFNDVYDFDTEFERNFEFAK